MYGRQGQPKSKPAGTQISPSVTPYLSPTTSPRQKRPATFSPSPCPLARFNPFGPLPLDPPSRAVELTQKNIWPSSESDVASQHFTGESKVSPGESAPIPSDPNPAPAESEPSPTEPGSHPPTRTPLRFS